LELLHDENLLLQKTPGRYEFHDLLRAYAAGRADYCVPGDERQAAVHRILTWYMVTMDSAARTMVPDRPSMAIPAGESLGYATYFATSTEAMNWCEQEHANLLDAVESASSHALPYHAWRLPAAVSAFLIDIENWEGLERVSRLGMEAAGVGGEVEVEALFLDFLGFAEGQLRKFADSEDHFKQALRNYRHIQDRKREAAIVARLAMLYSISGQPEKGVEISSAAIATAGPAMDSDTKFLLVTGLATCLHELDRISEALDCLTEFQTQLQQSPMDGMGPYLTALAYRNIGFTHLKLQNFFDAESAFGEALTQARLLGNRYWEAEFLYGMAAALRGQERVAESRECIARSMAIVDELEETKVPRVRERLAASPLWFQE